MSNTWRLTRETAEWAGPIVLSITDGQGVPVTDDVIKFAVMPRYHRPTEDDWADPYLDPEGSGALGVLANPVDGYGMYGIWVKVSDDPETPVLQPSEVGWILRT